MKKFIRNTVIKVMRKLFGSILKEIVNGTQISTTQLVRNTIEDCEFVSMGDYDFDDFISEGDYDFDEMVTTRDFNPDDYVTQTNLDDQMDFDPDDFVRCDDFDPDEYIMRHELESELADCGFQQLNPDDFILKAAFDAWASCCRAEFVTKKDFQNFEAKEIGMESFNALQDVRCGVQDLAKALDKLAADYCQRKQEGIEQQ